MVCKHLHVLFTKLFFTESLVILQYNQYANRQHYKYNTGYHVQSSLVVNKFHSQHLQSNFQSHHV